MDTTLVIDGEPTNLHVFVVPEMNLSSARKNMVKHSFSVTIPKDALIQAIEPLYLAWVAESKEDDLICGGPQDELAEAGYPDLNELIKSPDLMDLVFGSYLQRELFEAFLPPNIDSIRYWFDDIVGCSYDGRVITLTGICYSKP